MQQLTVQIAPNVSEALRGGRPVVAIESTLIAHGMPYPENLHTVLDLEKAIREGGAEPATIGVVKGTPTVGLAEGELETIALAKDVYKVGRLDLPVVMAKRWNGAVTVAAGLFLAKKAGIRVMATSGIGGVHRDVQETFDVSGDLYALARTDAAVVCAGVKSVLDIDWTLERLESLGVPVLGFRTDFFPAFYYGSSGRNVDYRVDTPDEVARIMATKWGFGPSGAVLVANPIPEAYALNEKVVEDAVGEALQEVSKRGIRGKGVTPFLLSFLHNKTGGKALEANVAIVKHNAHVAARVARAYAALAAGAE